MAAPPALPRTRKYRISLHSTIALSFTVLIVPILALILAYSYRENSQHLIARLDTDITRALDDRAVIARNLFEPVTSTLRIVAEAAAASPGYFRTEQSRDLLYRALVSADHIDAVYASFEDGYHRVVTRLDAARQRSDPRIPAGANWHSSFVDAYSDRVPAATTRTRHRTFFDVWPNAIQEYDSPNAVDFRTLPQYVGAKRTRSLEIADPIVNPDTGSAIMPIGVPIIVGGDVVGVVTANVTFDALSRYLGTHRISPRSETLIIDQAGRILAHPDPAAGVRTTDGKVTIATIDELADPVAVGAVRAHAAAKAERVEFTLPSDGLDYVALFGTIPVGIGKQWTVLVVAPVDDFIGGLKTTNRRLVLLILSMIVIEVLLTFMLARRITRPVQRVTEEIEQVEALNFDRVNSPASWVREIHNLQQAADLMRSSLRSFLAFVPIGIVRQLVESGKPLTLSGEARFLTIFFSDLENFTSVSEALTPDQLMQQVSLYFEAVAGAIAQEAGTIDKFIGDSVMAFWGAPAPVEDQVFRACVGALRAAARVRRLNEEWARDGRPQMRVRIGLHCADVVVGNVGSADRLNYTVMGDGVNVASRLEGLNKSFNTTICISDSVHDAVADRIVARPLELVSVKGRQAKIMAYELVGIREPDDPELRGAAGGEPSPAVAVPLNDNS